MSNISEVNLLSALVLSAIVSQAQSAIIGNWDTIDDNTGEVKATVEIFTKDGLVFGRIIKVVNVGHADPICDKCSSEDDRFGKEMPGMEIIRDLKRSGDHYADGKILNRENGQIYRRRIRMDGEKLMVRGVW